ncbi:hypothetical protein KFV09_16330 [Anoxybacillus rupiensis]|uniref:condensation domain-containing protein n=1 Tax=Anoxybacteroides rupiense TaxID=311460 RepID=UPI001BAC9431|nr:condensation domain-containing protein [Anoxybacillus rupiensis]MBS2773078.1 hypothetical protein [Anoxybacillus rupiensis]
MDIAVIGVSGIFPDAENLDKFYENLSNGIFSVKKLPLRRKETSGSNQSALFGYLEQIDEFDYNFFNISKSEADHMDPHQRILLQLVCSAIENAGYRLEDFKGSKTSLILSGFGGPKPEYIHLASKFHPTLLTGNSYAISAGRISYFLGLRGPSMIIDTSCSSSLTALHESCNKLILGEVEYAITGGVRLLSNLNFPSDIKFGMESKSNMCKAFDDSADGVVGGEGGGILLLKPLEKAIKDKDVIHAVIKGSASNQDGNLSNGITAPSPQAQTEVIISAWKKANVNPETISYIEAHGTGTKLGDPIEIQGLTDAFNQFTDKRNFCYIGSLKSNIGHLAEAAGIAGVIKAILSLKHKKIFPSLHIKKLNRHIDFENSAVMVNTELRDWNIENNGKRRAGVSSFGMSGTNVHVVLEEAPVINYQDEEEEKGPYLFTFSAKSTDSLKKYKKLLISYLKNSRDNLKNISYVLNKGRDDYNYRISCVASSRHELIEKLNKINVTERCLENPSIIFLFSHDFEIPENIFQYLTIDHPRCKDIYNQYFVKFPSNDNESVRKFIFQYLLYFYWISKGIIPEKVIGVGLGNLVVKVIMGKITLEEAILNATDFDETITFDKNRFKNLILSFNEKSNPIFLGMNKDGELFKELLEIRNELDFVSSIASYEEDNYCSLIKAISDIYSIGGNINWDKYYEGQHFQRLEIPTYPFEKTKCWLDFNENNCNLSFNNISPKNELNSNETRTIINNDMHIQKKIKEIWCTALNLDQLNVEDNFFEIGGNSLISIHIIEKLENEFNIELDYDIILDYPTVRELSQYLLSLIEEGNHTEDLKNENKIIEEINQYPLSFAQEGIWYLNYLDPNSSSYNIPCAIRLVGNLDINILEKSIIEIIKRHESLRTVFPLRDGKPIALINNDAHFSLKIVDLQTLDENLKEEEVDRINKEESLRPFNVEEGPLFRATLLKIRSDCHILIFNMHHLISDNWSYQIFLKELVTLYQTISNKSTLSLEEIKMQYSEFAIEQRKRMSEKEIEKYINFWKKKLSGAPELLVLPSKKRRPKVQSFEGSTYAFNIPTQLINKLTNLSNKEGTTLYMTLLAGWKTLLYRYSGQEDIVIGMPVAGRKVATEGIIGNFVNSVAVRSRLSENMSFKELLKNIRREVSDSINYSDLPFNLVVDKLNITRSLSYTPVFQVMFDYHHNSMIKELIIPDLSVTPLKEYIDKVKCDLEMVIMNGREKTEGLLIFNTDIFEEDDMKILVSLYLKLLKYVVDNPSIKLIDIPLTESQNLIVVNSDNSDYKDNFNF